MATKTADQIKQEQAAQRARDAQQGTTPTDKNGNPTTPSNAQRDADQREYDSKNPK